MAAVLVVDDKEENLYYLRALLEGHGHVVETARHGAEALFKARKSPPQLVVSDLLMPVMDGYTLLRHWKADGNLMGIPFIVYTATYTEAEDERLALDLGADAFIIKPCEPEQFIAKLRAVQENAVTARLGQPKQPVGDESSILKHYSQTLIRKLEEKTLQLEQANRALQQELAERKAILEEIDLKNTILQTQQETSLDAILVVDENQKILSFNQQFIDLWHIPEALIEAGEDEPVFRFNTEQVENPEAFVAQVKYLYENREAKSSDELILKDGRIIDRYSAPVIGADGKYYGRIWYFRDITDRKQAQLSLLSSEREQRQLAGMLEAERARLVAAQRVAKVGSWETDLSTMALIWSEETYRIFEVDPEDFMPTHQQFLQRVHPEDRRMVDEALVQSLSSPASNAIEHRLLMQDGRIKFVEEHWQIVLDAEGQPLKAIGTCQDITQHKTDEHRIKRLNRVLAVLSQINALIVRVQDRRELFEEACKIAAGPGGFHMAMIAMIDRNDMHMIPVASAGKADDLLCDIKEILSSRDGVSKTMCGRAIHEKMPIVANNSRNDSRVVFDRKYTEAGVNSIVVMPLIVADEAVGVLALYSDERDFFHEEEMQLLDELTQDISFAIDHIEKQERLNYLAYYDMLTGLANRSLFLERVGQFIRSVDHRHKTALFLIDLERFKSINDSMGRPVGDMLLIQVTAWLKKYVGDANLLARVDADRFAGVLPSVKQDGEVARLVEKMLMALLDNSFILDEVELRIGAKIGIAIYPDDGDDAESLFRNAESALKMAKKNSDRYLFHTKGMTESVAARLSMENRLRQAIEKEEFLLYYQPKVSLESGKVVAAEALIRWNDPHAGLVSPGEFIPILEETGLIYEVGRWALRKSIEDYLRWCAAGLQAVRIAVNVSPLQLRNPGFSDEIKRTIGVDMHAASGLELEITESMIMENMAHSIATLQTIRDMGVSIAVDDFGTGFSSLGYLSKLPVDTLKIDRSFVIDMTAKPEGLALVSTIISLAHSLKLKVVAEGVESEEQSRLLGLLGCDEMQGFLVSQPVPADVFEAKFLN